MILASKGFALLYSTASASLTLQWRLQRGVPAGKTDFDRLLTHATLFHQDVLGNYDHNSLPLPSTVLNLWHGKYSLTTAHASRDFNVSNLVSNE